MFIEKADLQIQSARRQLPMGMRRGNGSLSKTDGYLVQRVDSVTGGVHAMDGSLLMLVDCDIAVFIASCANGLGELRTNLASQCQINGIEAV